MRTKANSATLAAIVGVHLASALFYYPLFPYSTVAHGTAVSLLAYNISTTPNAFDWIRSVVPLLAPLALKMSAVVLLSLLLCGLIAMMRWHQMVPCHFTMLPGTERLFCDQTQTAHAASVWWIASLPFALHLIALPFVVPAFVWCNLSKHISFGKVTVMVALAGAAAFYALAPIYSVARSGVMFDSQGNPHFSGSFSISSALLSATVFLSIVPYFLIGNIVRFSSAIPDSTRNRLRRRIKALARYRGVNRTELLSAE